MIILASGSPRRRQLLEQVGIAFTVAPSQAEEAVDVSRLAPAVQARALAQAKARDVSQGYPDQIVLGADTIVVAGSEVLGKPADGAAAAAILERLQGRSHEVITGVALVHAATGRELVAHEATTVWIRPLTTAQIWRYVNSGEPMDKAGAYAVQGRAGALVERISGCYYNVVGLPLPRVVRMLEELGMEVL